MNENDKLRLAAEEFAAKASKLFSVLEIAIAGSIAGGDPYPNDVDVAVIVRSLDELPALARYARQMSGHCQSWDVFIFNEEMLYLGRICDRKKCPGMSRECSVPGCGQPPHLRIIPGFEYDERMFMKSPMDILWSFSNLNRLSAFRKKLGIIETTIYPVREDMELECVICGRRFVFSGAEQKHFQMRGFHPPKRCPECRERRMMIRFGSTALDEYDDYVEE